eukprot:CAMPEP_0118724878 /NCGR_PEP_ID=MMETSP0800-20121206/32834_1 /TAXON_ID=210618 ORGANISM="Striatella unipunctata, Strain CCMP2910" /NCGR_SAMPLE_ID=MMETSP0800 /ASSEMBLY_ACC=CAM_ASM_000638 /LENGTH=114 /DNA_ID=CAMNT_0006633525 /DNA_START=30 /DNA_END=371 /DNA_ORIENTATION=+
MACFTYKWVMMMILNHSATAFLNDLQGTTLMNIFNRAMGSRIGRDAVMMAAALEADLLQICNGASIGLDCDVNCHTVENMEGVVMPGGTMEPKSVLLEQSQVLKGETVDANEVW